MPSRVYLLVNESSGTGHTASDVRSIEQALRGGFEGVDTVVVEDHPEAAERARRILLDSEKPATLFVGGGGGTLRAVIEGIAAASNGGSLPGGDNVRIAPLRMGSGNLLAKELGVPRDPVTACARLVSSLRAGRFSSRVIGRYDFEREHGMVETRYAAGLAGFGALGRVPGDLGRWRRGFPRLRRGLGRLFGIERWNDFEYVAATFGRTLLAALAPGSLEEVEIETEGEARTLRLLAGVALSFSIAILPFEGKTSHGMTLHFVPYRSRFQAASLVPRARHHARSAILVEVSGSRGARIRLVDRERVEMFLDEDPIELHRSVSVSLAGSLTFVSGRAS